MKKILSAEFSFFLISVVLLFTACSEIPEEYLLDRAIDPSIEIVLHTAGEKETFTVGDLSFSLIYAPKGLTFPIFYDDSGVKSVDLPFWIGETEVTFQLWSAVYIWASGDTNMSGVIDGTETQGAYHFANKGLMGSVTGGSGMTNLHPVTCVNWRDSLVWCNALTEWVNINTSQNLTCVYKDGTLPIRDSRSANSVACDNALQSPGATGFRLPSSLEWELAARWKGGVSAGGAIEIPQGSRNYWTPGSHASGSDGEYTDAETTGLFAWYGKTTTNPVAQKRNNLLGIYDMSGNAREWCFTASGTTRYVKGGAFNQIADLMRIGSSEFYLTLTQNDNSLGFRISRSSIE